MSIDLDQIESDWKSLGKKLAEANFPIPLGEIHTKHLQHETSTFTDVEELRRMLSEIIQAAQGWLMLTDALLQLPNAETLPLSTPLQGEWQVSGSSWQLRYLCAEQGWRLDQYTVSDSDQVNQATHLAEPITHLKADGLGHIRYQKLWAIENDRNGEPAPVPVLALLTGYGEKE